MPEEIINELVEELLNDSFELNAFISNVFASKDLPDEEIEALAKELGNSPLDLRQFVIQWLDELK